MLSQAKKKSKKSSGIEEPDPDWKYKMEQKLKKQYGDNDDAIYGTINKIWYHEMTPSSRAKVKKKKSSFDNLASRLSKIASKF